MCTFVHLALQRVWYLQRQTQIKGTFFFPITGFCRIELRESSITSPDPFELSAIAAMSMVRQQEKRWFVAVIWKCQNHCKFLSNVVISVQNLYLKNTTHNSETSFGDAYLYCILKYFHYASKCTQQLNYFMDVHYKYVGLLMCNINNTRLEVNCNN